MTSLRELAAQVSVDLNDYAPGHEFTTWSEQQLISYLVEGLQVAFTMRPDLFIRQTVIKLEPGTAWQKPCDCTQIHRVYGVCTEQGRILYEIRRRKAGNALSWTGPRCVTDPRHFRLESYAIETATDTLYVDPVPPAGQDVYLLISCAIAPTLDSATADGVPVELQAAAIQWALYRAKMMDSENDSTILTAAREHKQTFLNLLQLEVTAQRQELTAPAQSAQEATGARQ